LLSSLEFGGNDWLKHLYLSRLKKYNSGTTSPDMEVIRKNNLENNTDIIASRCEYYFYHNHFEKAYQVSKKVIEEDPYEHGRILVIHLSCLVELHKKSDLFSIAHKLVETQPTLAVSWYSVGCYYYLIKKYDRARKFFSKSTNCNRDFGPAWLGFGHAFAVEGEHDQALAAYRSANRLMSRSHLPHLCIGIEHLRANNLPLARQFMNKSMSLCPYDPLVFNEIGVIEFKDGRYLEAIRNFELAVSLLNEEYSLVSWEPIFFNLGHCYRKTRQYPIAIKYYKKALKLSQNGSTYTSLGFTHQLLGNISTAIEFYHKALGIEPEDHFASSMLQKALQDFVQLDFNAQLMLDKETSTIHDESSEFIMDYDFPSEQDMSLDVSVNQSHAEG